MAPDSAAPAGSIERAALAQLAAGIESQQRGLEVLRRDVDALRRELERAHAPVAGGQAADEPAANRGAPAPNPGAPPAPSGDAAPSTGAGEPPARDAAPPTGGPPQTPSPDGPPPAPASRPAGGLRRRLRGALPIAALIVGALLVADAVATMVWQEPLSALYTSYEQQQLASDLNQLQQSVALIPPGPPKQSARARLAVLAARLERSSHNGQALGRITIRSIGADFIVVQGTDTLSLTKGPGHYRGTVLPGAAGTTAIAGHRTTFLAPFRRIDSLKRGASIIVRMPYGRFDYTVTDQRVVSPTDASVLRGGHGRLVLTSCDPVFSAAKRRVVFARLVRAVPSTAARV